MREIYFRAKSLETGNWIYGGFCAQYGDPEEDHIGPAIISHSKGLFSVGTLVSPKTVGQFTGLSDKNGNQIFEGDILAIPSTMRLVKFVNGQFVAQSKMGLNYNLFLCSSNSRIVGNIHDNPEML